LFALQLFFFIANLLFYQDEELEAPSMDRRNRHVHYLIPCPRTRLGSTAPSLKTFMNTYAAQLQPQKRQISSTESPPEEPKRRKTRSSKVSQFLLFNLSTNWLLTIFLQKIQDDSTTSKAASPIPQTQVEILETEDAVQKAKVECFNLWIPCVYPF